VEERVNNDWFVVLTVAAEGGSISLIAKQLVSGKWVYKKTINEINFDYEEKGECIQPTREVRAIRYPLPNHNIEAESWENALQLIGRYPWEMLAPIFVHPEFQEQVWRGFKGRWKQNGKESIDDYSYNRWAKLCFPNQSREVVTLASLIQSASYVTVLTGAGMSTESNIPDFRSKEGWWRNIDPKTVATTEALENHYDLFHEFYSMRINGLKNCAPHRGHEILASWEQRGIIQAISTQNVDGFHKASGNKNIYELHGNIHAIRCKECSSVAGEEQFLNKDSCSQCGGQHRPGVVLFGETLPEDSWNTSLYHISKSDLVIVIGTSLEVYPASSLPQMTNGKTAYINTEISGNRPRFDLVIKGKAGEVLRQVDDLL
jgi:NAD-dependent SIR2 family protein deacetylase